jgi:phosphate transport system substrate-binding protein
MRPLITAALTAVLTVLSSEASSNETVTLTSRAGDLSVSGRFLSFDGAFYRIDSIYGVLTVDAAGVDCTGLACPGPGAYVAELMVSGIAATGERLLPKLLEAFADARGLTYVRQEEDDTHFLYVVSDPASDAPVARIRFRVTSADEGMADLIAEQADIALTFREPTEQERAWAMEAGLGDLSSPARSQVLALDGLVAVVPPERGERTIRYRDLSRILTGAVTAWPEKDQPVSVHLSAETPMTAQILPEGTRPALEVRRYLSGADLEQAMADDPYAIGFTKFSQISATQPLSLSGSCGAEVPASLRTIKAEDYPLTAPYFMFTPGRRAPEFLRDFLAYLQSAEAQVVIRRQGFVDRGIEMRPFEAQGDRLIRAILSSGRDVTARDLRRMAERLNGASQMSLSFRFEDGSADLDAQSRANIPLLVSAIRSGAYDGSTILLAGFSDGQGNGAQNLALSLRRAESVRDALYEALPPETGVEIVAEGFGEALPMACDADAWGRKVNRRVEVWLRQK